MISLLIKKRGLLAILMLVALAVIGTVLVISSTSEWGVGLTPDSAAYIGAARNFLNGRGLSIIYHEDGVTPMSIWAPPDFTGSENVMLWPPLYPMVLAFFGLFSLDMFEVARFLSAVFFGLNILAAGLIIKKITRSFWMTGLGGALILASGVVFSIHNMAWSEPLFLFLCFLSLFLLIKYLEDQKDHYLYIFSILAALAMFTRYVGITLIGVITLSILFFNMRKIKRRIVHTVIFLAISCIPAGSWMVFVNSPSRSLVYHPVTWLQLKVTILNISTWLLPENIPGIYRVAITGAVILAVAASLVLIAVQSRRQGKGGNAAFIRSALVLAAYIVIYLAFLIASKSFFDAHVALRDYRILSPVFISVLILAFYYLRLLIMSTGDRRSTVILTAIVCLMFLAFYSIRLFDLYAIRRDYGHPGYANRDWSESETMRFVEDIGGSIPLYSNSPDGIYLLTGKAAAILPLKFSPYTLEENPFFQEQMDRMLEDIRKSGGLIVYFDMTTRDYLPSRNELIEDLEIDIINQSDDGAVYKGR